MSCSDETESLILRMLFLIVVASSEVVGPKRENKLQKHKAIRETTIFDINIV
jgi:hypothetical protein